MRVVSGISETGRGRTEELQGVSEGGGGGEEGVDELTT